MEELDLKETEAGISLKVKVQPRASRNKIAGISADCLKLQLMSLPVEGEANEACIEFLADKYRIAKSNITIAAGQRSRTKVIKIAGFTKQAFLQLIAQDLHTDKV